MQKLIVALGLLAVLAGGLEVQPRAGDDAGPGDYLCQIFPWLC